MLGSVPKGTRTKLLGVGPRGLGMRVRVRGSFGSRTETGMPNRSTSPRWPFANTSPLDARTRDHPEGRPMVPLPSGKCTGVRGWAGAVGLGGIVDDAEEVLGEDEGDADEDVEDEDEPFG